MTLDDFRSLIRAYVPGAKIRVVDNTLLTLLINKAVDDVNAFGVLLPNDEPFNVKAEQMTYDMRTEVVSDYLTMDRSGIWWNAGTSDSTNWVQLDPVTEKWLDRFHTNWRDESSSDPKYYYIKKGKLNIFPKPKTALTDGFWIYYVQASVNMTLGTHYPFTGSTDELTFLRDMDDPIIDYVRWKLQRPLGKEASGIVTEKGYEAIRLEKLEQVNKRADISAHRDAKMRGPYIRSTHHGGRARSHH